MVKCIRKVRPKKERGGSKNIALSGNMQFWQLDVVVGIILLLRGIFGTPTFVTLLPNQISIHPLLKLSQIEKWMDYYWGWPGLNR